MSTEVLTTRVPVRTREVAKILARERDVSLSRWAAEAFQRQVLAELAGKEGTSARQQT